MECFERREDEQKIPKSNLNECVSATSSPRVGVSEGPFTPPAQMKMSYDSFKPLASSISEWSTSLMPPSAISYSLSTFAHRFTRDNAALTPPTPSHNYDAFYHRGECVTILLSREKD